jgi:lysophospholipase L1-like esterase
MRSFLYLLLLLLTGCSASYEVQNIGVAGNNSVDLLRRVDTAVVARQPDLVLLLLGTNDMMNSKKLIPLDSFMQNYRELVQRIQTTGAKLVLLSIPPVDTGYIFQRHPRNAFEVDPNEKIRLANKSIQQLTMSNPGLYFFDLYELFAKGGSPNRTRESLLVNEQNLGKPDGVHPTRDGYAKMAESLYAYLIEKKLLKKNRKLICFGDSITFGAFMEGAGTTEGDSYPAQLKRLLNSGLR